jgi:ankyrin repeat protein
LLKDVIYLIERGSSPDQKDSKGQNYLLHIATKSGHFDIVKCLIEKGAEINAKDKEEKTTLHWASKEGHLEIVQCLIEKGADVNAKDTLNQTALHFASGEGHLELVQCLLENGALSMQKLNMK